MCVDAVSNQWNWFCHPPIPPASRLQPSLSLPKEQCAPDKSVSGFSFFGPLFLIELHTWIAVLYAMGCQGLASVGRHNYPPSMVPMVRVDSVLGPLRRHGNHTANQTPDMTKFYVVRSHCLEL